MRMHHYDLIPHSKGENASDEGVSTELVSSSKNVQYKSLTIHRSLAYQISSFDVSFTTFIGIRFFMFSLPMTNAIARQFQVNR